MWQALTERVSGKPANREVTLVFTDLVGFSAWSLRAGDEATLRLLRRVSQVVEPPLLQAGGHIVKRMGDGIMAVFSEPVTAVRAAIAAREAVKAVDVDGYTPRMRVGVHTGRPQRIGSDWLGVDVNIAARVMERATRGELVVSASTLVQISDEDFESLGVTAKRLRRQVFTAKQDGVPAGLSPAARAWRRGLGCVADRLAIAIATDKPHASFPQGCRSAGTTLHAWLDTVATAMGAAEFARFQMTFCPDDELRHIRSA